MIYTPISHSWMHHHAPTMSHTQLGLLLRLMDYVCERQQWLPLDITICRRIASAHTRDDERELDRVLSTHFYIDNLGRIPQPQILQLLGPVKFAAADGLEPSGSDNLSRPLSLRYRYPITTSGDERVVIKKSTQKRYRDQREALKVQAREKGFAPRKHASLRELNEMLVATSGSDNQPDNLSLPVPLRTRTPADLQTPIPNTEDIKHSSREAVATGMTAMGAVCIAMRQAGIGSVQQSHPILIALMEAGATPDEMADAAREAVARGKPFAYALAVAKGRRDDAARIGPIAAKRDSLAEWAGSAAPMLKPRNGHNGEKQ